MNDYIILDNKRYKAIFGQWAPTRVKPAKIRKTLAGATDATYGPAITVSWEGTLIVPVTPSGSSWGSDEDLRTSFDKLESLSFTDHYGDTCNVIAAGVLQENSLTPTWDSVLNRFLFRTTLVRE